MKKLIITKPTIIKLRPLDSSILKAEEELNATPGQEFEFEETEHAPGGHIEVKLREPLNFKSGEYSVVYFFSKHIQLLTEQPEQDHIKLEVPYKSQTDNHYNPSGSCNVTSIAMCLEYFSAKRKEPSIAQFEDELYIRMQQLGWSRHSPVDLAKIVTTYGIEDKFDFTATIEATQKHLESGNPCVTHGYFTSFGHIIVLVGYDEKGFIVHDPWGEWFSNGYIRNDNLKNDRGKFLHYSYGLIQETCMTGGEFWVHFISK